MKCPSSIERHDCFSERMGKSQISEYTYNRWSTLQMADHEMAAQSLNENQCVAAVFCCYTPNS